MKDKEFQKLLKQHQTDEVIFLFPDFRWQLHSRKILNLGENKRAGSDSKHDNVEFQERIENNILNVFEQMLIKDKKEDKNK